jgi:probable rRNA maturation factor
VITINFDNKTNTNIDLDQIGRLSIKVFNIFSQTKGELELLIIDRENIREMNQKYRSIDKPTDVLSFPQIESPSPKKMLGSIVICPEIVHEKGETIEEVFVHGCLHLLGFDHERDENEWDKALDRLKI